MTNEQLALVEQLLVNGVATKETKILGGKAVVLLNSLTTGDQLAVEFEMKAIEGTPAYMVHTYSLKLVSRVLKAFTYGEKTSVFTTAEAAYEFIMTRPSAIVDAIINEHTKFEKELAELSAAEGLVENFTETPSVSSKPN